jgi:hypothetical protein
MNTYSKNKNMNFSQEDPCVSKIHEQTNTRIYDRNLPSQMLQPYLDVRPVMTKYSYFPIVDPRAQPTVPLNVQPTFNVNKTFNPGNTFSPWSGYAANVNVESELKNQIYALQKCSQSVYVPSSKSDLYEYKFQPKHGLGLGSDAHNLLFETYKFCDFNPNPDPDIVGSSLFLNSTRSQIKDMTHHNN